MNEDAYQAALRKHMPFGGEWRTSDGIPVICTITREMELLAKMDVLSDQLDEAAKEKK